MCIYVSTLPHSILILLMQLVKLQLEVPLKNYTCITPLGNTFFLNDFNMLFSSDNHFCCIHQHSLVSSHSPHTYSSLWVQYTISLFAVYAPTEMCESDEKVFCAKLNFFLDQCLLQDIHCFGQFECYYWYWESWLLINVLALAGEMPRVLSF